MRGPKIDLKQSILRHMAGASTTSVWTPTDFLDLGSRKAVDQALHRLVDSNAVRRIERGLYDIPHVDVITGAPVEVDHVAVVNAIGRRDRSTPVIESVFTGEDPDIPNARRVIVSTKARLKPLKIGTLKIEFKRPKAREKGATSVPKKAPVRLTGGEGHGYEDYVAARFLIDVLAGTNSLGRAFGRIARIHWQARDKGWLADDLALECETGKSEKRDVGISVKSDQQVNSAGFPAIFTSLAWSQWLGRGTNRVFRRGMDAIVLVTAKLPANLKRAWEALLSETLETTTAPERIVQRLALEPGSGSQSSEQQRTLFGSLRPPEEHAAGLSASDIIRLLHDIRLLSFDFASPTSQDAVVALRDCQNILSSGSATEAENLWDRLIGISAAKRTKGGSIDLRELLSQLRDAFVFRDHPDFRADWEALERYSSEAMRGVQTSIGDTAHLPRNEELAEIRKLLASTGTCFLIGESGSGKSALAKGIASADYSRVVWLSASVLDQATPGDFDRALGLRHPFVEILRASPERCLVVIDGLEAYGESALRLVALFIQDLCSTENSHIHALLSVQFTAAERKMRQLASLGVSRDALQFTAVERPTDNNLKELLAKFPHLRQVAKRPELRPLLANLKVLDWLARSAVQDISDSGGAHIGLTGIIDRLWSQWTEGMNNEFSRSHLLMNLGVAEADALSRGVPRRQMGFAEQSALPALVQSGLIRVDNDRVSFGHDLLGDWARMRVLVAEDPTISTTSRSRVLSPRWQQAVRLFGQRLLERSAEDQMRWRRTVEVDSEDASPDALMRDLFLDSLFLAVNANELMERAWPMLGANNGRLLNRLLDRFHIVATFPNHASAAFSEDEADAARIEHLFRLPFTPYWGPLLTLLHAHREEVARIAPYEGARICELWLRATHIELGQGFSFPWRKQAAELAIDIASEVRARNVENSHHSGQGDRIVYEALLHAATEFPDVVGELCLELAMRRELPAALLARRDLARQKRLEERKRLIADGEIEAPRMIGFSRGRRRAPWPHGPRRPVEREFREACLLSGPFAALAKAAPDVALEVLLAVCIEEPQYDDHFARSSLPECGLAYWPQGDPPAYFRGSFLQFLRHAPDQGLSIVLTLVNFGTHRYTEDRHWIEVTIAGQTKRWYGDSNVFRWHHDWPLSHGSQIQSSLMALEQWLYEQLDSGANIDPWISRIIVEAESLAFAGLLMDIGKRAPELFGEELAPLFSSWEIWELDFQLTILRNTDMQVPGYWGNQPQQLIELAQKWHRLPHRFQYLLGPDGPIVRNMLSREDLHPFFAEVRDNWSKHLDSEGEPEHLRLLIERINPHNYTFVKNGTELAITFQWPDEIEQKNNEDLRRLQEQQKLTQLPWRCRAILDAGTPLTVEQAIALFDYLQAIEGNAPEIPMEAGEPLFRIEDVYCGGIAVLFATNSGWLFEDADRLAWCRKLLQSTVDHPPPTRSFDSELSVGNYRWDVFAAECGVRLLAEDATDELGRQLVAAGLTGFNYHTSANTMALAFRLQKKLGKVFNQMLSFSILWAGLRPLQIVSADTFFEVERAEFAKRKNSLIEGFVDGKTATVVPSLQKLNAETRAALDDHHEKRFPGSAARARRKEKSGSRSRSRKTLYPDRLGLDPYVMRGALGWLNLQEIDDEAERRTYLNLVRECLGVALGNLPVVEVTREEEIDGLPNTFDEWVLQLVARTIPALKASERPEELWQSILERGAPAHQWVERFFWHWFTNGLAASSSLAEFVRLWHPMISYALVSPMWDPNAVIGYELEGAVFELLCFDIRWNALVRDNANAGAVGAMEEAFSRAFQRWGCAPKVTNGFAVFAVQPGAKRLLLPILTWISAAAKTFDSYDWKYGLEENVIELLRVCWQREAQRISDDPVLKEAFLSLLAILASRGSHPALVLRDRVAGSGDV